MLPLLDDGLWPGPQGGFTRRQGLPSNEALPQMVSMGGPGGGDGGDSVNRSGRDSVDRSSGFGFGSGYGRATGGGMTEDDWGDDMDVSYSRRSSADGYSDRSRVPASATAGQRAAAEAAAHAGAADKQQQRSAPVPPHPHSLC